MRMRLTDPVRNQVIYEKELPDDYAPLNGIEQSEIEVAHAVGRASMRDIWFDGLHVSFGSVHLFDNLIIKAECDTPVIEMHFALAGRSEAIFTEYEHSLRFDAGQHNISYMPEFEGYFKSERQNEIYKMLEVHVTEQYFNRFSNSESPLLERFHEQILKKQASVINPQNMPITMSMNSILQEIVTCKRQGVMKRLFLEARILELLMLQMEQFESPSNTKKKDTIHAGDIEKLHHAKAIIEQNISRPYTLSQLSRCVGLNDFKLKKGFKQTFGTTVFGYLHELRMQEARRLLLDTSTSIHEVSDYCGYSYVQHFTTAFKSKFGVTPGNVRE